MSWDLIQNKILEFCLFPKLDYKILIMNTLQSIYEKIHYKSLFLFWEKFLK